MIVAVVTALTPVVAMLKVVVFEPDATVTVAGTVAYGLFDERETLSPPEGAGELRVIVPVDVAPAETVAGLKESRAVPARWANLVTDDTFP